ncbi:MAG TPA: NAD-binding protein [Ardenticatenaceae bacterium]|nr:NAD-binding protein [Ardenticatenaceae bacterium]
MRQITRADRLRYQFDNLMSRGATVLMGWLFLLALILVLIVAVLVLATGISPVEDSGGTPGFVRVFWVTLMRAMDPGAVSGDSGGWGFLLAMLVVTLGGIFTFSMLIGLMTSGLESKLEELRKGRSFVTEEGHTVILGWSLQVFSIISELIIANANQRRSCIVILANKDKVEMEDEIREKIGKTGRTQIVCRSGDPIDLTDLDIVNPHAARSIIILAPENENPDSHVIKAILALTNNPGRRPQPYHIVAEIRDAKNMEAARLVGRNEAELVLVSDLISRITVQTCRQSGLSAVYMELLDFGGDEIYFQEEPGLVGRSFGDALLAYEDSAIIGLHHRDGHVRLNPPMETPIGAGDQVIAISQDDDTIRLSGLSDYGIDASAIVEAPQREPVPERTLILGWNERGPAIINELDHYVAAGSEVTVLDDSDDAETYVAGIGESLRSQTVQFMRGDMTDRRTLESLAISTYNHVIVLSDASAPGPQEADACTLITLLHLRDIGERSDVHFSIVSEMLDIRNRDLATVTRADDFIVSDILVSLVLAQISERKALAEVFRDLFDPEGSELHLKPAGDYVQLGRPLNFYTVAEAARRRGEVAVGYHQQTRAASSDKLQGARLNPRKSERVTFTEGDRIIVLAEE